MLCAALLELKIPLSEGQHAAAAYAKKAANAGLPKAGYLKSSDFSSLHPGYFVVYFGIYDSEAEAQSHVIDAHRHGYRGPYPRPISP